jgi:hypothetical protein
MITENNADGLIWFEYNTPYYSYLAFSLADLLNSLPKELKNICLTQLN